MPQLRIRSFYELLLFLKDLLGHLGVATPLATRLDLCKKTLSVSIIDLILVDS